MVCSVYEVADALPATEFGAGPSSDRDGADSERPEARSDRAHERRGRVPNRPGRPEAPDLYRDPVRSGADAVRRYADTAELRSSLSAGPAARDHLPRCPGNGNRLPDALRHGAAVPATSDPDNVLTVFDPRRALSRSCACNAELTATAMSGAKARSPSRNVASASRRRIFRRSTACWAGDLYRQADIRRIVSAEHTALVSRQERDRLQERFAALDGVKPWEPNLLSAPHENRRTSLRSPCSWTASNTTGTGPTRIR